MTRRRPLWGRRQWTRLALAVIGLGMFLGCSWVVLAPQLWPALGNGRIAHGIGKQLFAWINGPPRNSAPVPGGPFAHSPLAVGTVFTYTIPNPPGPSAIPTFPPDVPIGKRLIEASPRGLRDVGPRDLPSQYQPLWSAADDCVGWYVSATQTGDTPAGFWAHTRTERTISAQIDQIPKDAPAADVPPLPAYTEAEIRSMFWTIMIAEGKWAPPRKIESALVSTGTWTHAAPIPQGYALNIGTILGLCLLLGFTPVSLRDAWRWWRFRRAGGCADCGYDLQGLPPGAPVCPECGKSIAAD